MLSVLNSTSYRLYSACLCVYIIQLTSSCYIYHTVSFSITTVALAVALGVQSSQTRSTTIINNSPSSCNTSSNTSSNTSDSNICFTPGCVQLAAQIIATMNQSADPCEDFYQFSCGNWVKDNILGQEGIAILTPHWC